jgi:twinkle protein
MNVWEFARSFLYPFKVKGSEIVPQHCPYCKGGHSHDKETFALNIDKKTYNCKRGSCGKSGTFWQLCNDNGVEADRENFEIVPVKKTYKKPQTKISEPTTQAEEYLKLRKISKETMKILQVGCDECGNIVFPYYENNELVMVKFRPSRKVDKKERKAWREEGGKPILWGMDLCTPELPLIITEGEIDTLSCYEAGLKNVVSVPSGSEDFTWLETCYEWLKQFTKIIFFGDQDEPGRKMIEKLTQKLNDYDCYIVHHSRKDANELLYYNGKEAVIKAVEEASQVPVYGLIDLADVAPVDIGQVDKVKSNVLHLDRAIGGFYMGETSLWTGKRGEGKSTLLGQLLIDAVDQNYPVCAYSGELRADRFQYWINLQAAGESNIELKTTPEGKQYGRISKEVLQHITEWYRGKFFVYDNKINKRSADIKSIIDIFTLAVKKYDCKVFLIDNLMKLSVDMSTEDNFYLQQVNFVNDLVEFGEKYNVHIHLVAHPKKTNEISDGDDISGSGHIPNLVHNVFSLSRNTDQKQQCDSILRIHKNREDGAKETIGLNYCKVSKRLYLPSVGNEKKYGWEKFNYKPVKQEEAEEHCPF